MGKLLGLLGHPVGHSMSPLMHNDAFQALGLPFDYHAFDVMPDQLETAIKGMKVLGFAGFNVTIPHKVAIMPFLDAIDQEARDIGAVNTVVEENGKYIGYNTDGKGFVSSLQKICDLNGKNTLIIGSGGAARGIFIALNKTAIASCDIANRTVAKAKSLIEEYSPKISSKSLSLQEAEEQLSNYDIVINTTSVGMSPHTNDIPLSLHELQPSTVVCDIIYNPLKTKWLEIAEEKGAIIHNGVGMFVGQGALAFEKWTGRQPDYRRMETVVLKKLGG